MVKPKIIPIRWREMNKLERTLYMLGIVPTENDPEKRKMIVSKDNIIFDLVYVRLKYDFDFLKKRKLPEHVNDRNITDYFNALYLFTRFAIEKLENDSMTEGEYEIWKCYFGIDENGR